MILHACWLLDPWRETRNKYVAAWARKGFEVNLWHQGQLGCVVPGAVLRDARDLIAASPIADAFAYEEHSRVHAACADLFRYEVLLQHGGTYADLDVLPLAPPGEVQEPRFERDMRGQLEIRYLAAPQGHELLRALRDEAVREEAAFVARGGYKTLRDLGAVLARTGPHMAMRVAQAWAASHSVPYGSMLLRKAVDANTRENRREHYSRRWPEVSSKIPR